LQGKYTTLLPVRLREFLRVQLGSSVEVVTVVVVVVVVAALGCRAVVMAVLVVVVVVVVAVLGCRAVVMAVLVVLVLVVVAVLGCNCRAVVVAVLVVLVLVVLALVVLVVLALVLHRPLGGKRPYVRKRLSAFRVTTQRRSGKHFGEQSGSKWRQWRRMWATLTVLL
jgi:hypothetical protein